MPDRKHTPRSKPEKRQNSYEENSASRDAEKAPDIQQPGPPGDFGNGPEPAPKDDQKT